MRLDAPCHIGNVLRGGDGRRIPREQEDVADARFGKGEGFLFRFVNGKMPARLPVVRIKAAVPAMIGADVGNIKRGKNVYRPPKSAG